MSNSKLVGWHIENFMSIEKADITFATQDNPNNSIILIKGYNDSGKSAALTALKVLLTNAHPTKQVGFIQDGKEYFRIIAMFTDDVSVHKTKYANGQGLYELYKGNDLIYSTKQGKTLTKITEVPKPIADYLGLIEFDGTYLNSRSCFEKQIGVQTTGSENYKMFNTVLKSEEIALASENINTDKNATMKTITSINAQIEANKGLLGRGAYITKGIIDFLKDIDNSIDEYDRRLTSLQGINDTHKEITEIKLTPEISEIDNKKLEKLEEIEQVINQIKQIEILPELSEIELGRLERLTSIRDMADQLADIVVAPEVKEIDNTNLEDLQSILNIAVQLGTVTNEIKAEEDRLTVLSNELDKMQADLQSLGVKLVKCPDCGCMFDPTVGHTD